MHYALYQVSNNTNLMGGGGGKYLNAICINSTSKY